VSYDSSRSTTAQPQGAAAEPQPGAPALPPRCLLVDDHELNLRLVKRLLERHGFEVRCSHSFSHRQPCIASPR
jgi:PleD family two-component response regulator